MKVSLPEPVLLLLHRLEKAGHGAYAVGGCVRDALRGETPKDWDLCTSASPKEMQQIFAGEKLLSIGAAHGTIGVFQNGVCYEITTFRQEKGHADHRHPDQVHFVPTVEQDLARRDYTINAMAYHPEKGLIDPFSGKEDLQKGCLRAVGRPEQRFFEDALRILRGLRFAARFGFCLEPQTAKAMHACKGLLSGLAAERVQVEMNGILLSAHGADVFLQYGEILGVVLPEILPMMHCPQETAYHCFDVYGHTMAALAHVPPVLSLKLAMLFHDAGKPFCRMRDEKGVDHFYGHPKKSAQLAETALQRLRYSNAVKEEVTTLVRYHDLQISREEKVVARWMQRLGQDRFFSLLEMKRGDIAAQSPAYQEKNTALVNDLEKIARKLLQEKRCFSLENLAVSGNDLLALGMPAGKEMGALLQSLLNDVAEGKISNQKEVLLKEAEKRMP